jgi:hypothetical protein
MATAASSSPALVFDVFSRLDRIVVRKRMSAARAWAAAPFTRAERPPGQQLDGPSTSSFSSTLTHLVLPLSARRTYSSVIFVLGDAAGLTCLELQPPVQSPTTHGQPAPSARHSLALAHPLGSFPRPSLILGHLLLLTLSRPPSALMSSRSGSRSSGSDSDRLSWSPSPSLGERGPSPPLCSSDPIFLRPTNDILLRSNDRQSFPFERALLEVQSPVFRDLVRGARPEHQSAQGELKHGGLRIADVDESATNLERLLRFLHPGAQRPQISSVGEVIR